MKPARLAHAQRHHLSWRRVAIVWGVSAAVLACGAPPAASTSAASNDVPRAGRSADPDRVATDLPRSWFADVAAATGLTFAHDNPLSGRFEIYEILPPGGALVDYDGDGDLDVFLLQTRGASRLFRNDLAVRADGSRSLTFVDVTAGSGLEVGDRPMGVATGDVDNDGCVDLYVTRFGPNQLFKNTCEGAFVDVSRRSRTDDGGWGVSAAFVDYDRDGWLDLYVGNYVHYDASVEASCHSSSGVVDYCTPQAFRYQPDRLFHNNRNGTFTDVSATALPGARAAPALGVSTADFDGDGWLDVFVANDGVDNQLWMNQRNGTFRDTALLAGVAVSAEGRPEGSMGVDAGDFDNDGDEDLFLTNLPGQGSNLLVNDGTGVFEDVSVRSKVGPSSLGFTGFGAAWLDLENDGLLDVIVANGAVAIRPGHPPGGFPYDERNQLFRNAGDGTFEDVSARVTAFEASDVSRGIAVGDIDNDGDADVVLTNNNGPVRLLINQIGARQHWIGLRLVDRGGGRDPLGARAVIEREDGVTLVRRARSDGSYASANDPRVLAGLGTSGRLRRVQVNWPDGSTDSWTDVETDRWTTLRQGTSR